MFVPFLSFLYCVGHFSLAFNTGTLVFRRSTQYKVLKGYKCALILIMKSPRKGSEKH